MEIVPIKALVNQKGWKVSLFKGMYDVRILALIQVIRLKGNKLIYVAKTLMSLMVLT